MQSESMKFETICQCCCQLVTDSEKVLNFSEKHVRLLKQLELSEFFQSLTGFFCSKCHDKLKVIESFRIEIIESQNKFKKIKQENFEALKEVHELVKKEESFPFASINLLSLVKLDATITEKKDLKQISKRKRKSASNNQDHHFCPICDKFFTESRKVKLHVARIHTGQRNFSCDLCAYKSFKKYEMLLHLNNIHSPKEQLRKIATCPTCGLSFTSNPKLSLHINRKHLQHETRKHSCDICGSKFSALNEIRNHVRNHLPRELKLLHACQFCQKKFVSKGSLKGHKDSQHSDKPSIECFCGKKFRQKSVYSRHCQVVHEGVKAYKCNFCQKEFGGKNHLDYHVKAFHTAVTLVPCEICGQKYKNEDTLKKHFIYHFDPKFSCNLCDAKFHENKKLLDHMSVHEKLKFSCEHCTRSFRLDSQLRAHLKKVHFKEKLTFICGMCSSSFTRKSTYRDHALRQHKELSKESMAQFLDEIKKSLAEEHKK